jgi:peptide alpha-N-acetyltransferase
MLYYVRLLEDLGEHSEALLILDIYAKSRVIVDRIAIMEARGELSYAS